MPRQYQRSCQLLWWLPDQPSENGRKSISAPGVYGSDSSIIVFTKQNGRVFTGYLQETGDPEVGYINGAVVGRSIRIGGDDFAATGTLLSSNIIVGTYSNVQIAVDDDDYETGTFIALKRVE